MKRVVSSLAAMLYAASMLVCNQNPSHARTFAHAQHSQAEPLTSTQATSEASSQANPQANPQANSQVISQTVRGTVVNAATQQPVAGASLRILEAGKGATARADGSFRIPNVPVGRLTLRVSALGYEPLSMPLVITSGKELILTLTLVEKIVRTEEISVDARRGNGFTAINEAAMISSNVFSLDDAYRFAGARADPARMAANFAGVVGANDTRNDIIIRGGSPVELLWRLDGLDIPNPNHFATQGATGGPVNALNVNMLANSDFLTGAFPAEYGDRLSGVFDLRTRKGNDERFEFMGQFGFNGIEGMAEGPIGSKASSTHGSFVVSYRKSFLDILSTLGINFGVGGVPRYEDLSIKLDLAAGERDKFWLTGLGGISDITIDGTKAKEIFTGDQKVKNATNVGVLGVHWQHIFSERVFGTLTLGAIANRYITDVDSITATKERTTQDLTRWYENSSLEGYFTAKYRVSVSPDVQSVITAGVESRMRVYSIHEQRFTPSWNSADGKLYSSNADGRALQVFGFVNWNYRITERLTANVGVHSQYLGVSNRATLEPRASLAWNVTDEQSLTLGTGIFRQSLPLIVYFSQQENNTLDFSQAIHYVAGYTNKISPDALFKAEAYYKDYSLVPVERDTKSSFSFLNAGTNFGATTVSSILENTGAGRTYGAELSLVKHFSGGWYAQAALSLVRQEFRGSDGVWRWGSFDNRYVANVLAGYEWRVSDGFTIEASARYNRAGGGAYTPVDVEHSRQLNRTILNTHLAFAERNPDYERVDVRVDFRQNFNGWALISYFSVENVLNRKNLLSRSFSVQRGEVVDNFQLGLFPIGGVRIEF